VSRYETNRVVSCGDKHIKFWTLSGNTLRGKRGVYGKAGTIATHLCLGFAEDETTFSGAKNGDIYKWRKNQLLSVLIGRCWC
jgi:microtubule-associated protein-like 6